MNEAVQTPEQALGFMLDAHPNCLVDWYYKSAPELWEKIADTPGYGTFKVWDVPPAMIADMQARGWIFCHHRDAWGASYSITNLGVEHIIGIRLKSGTWRKT